MDALAWNRFQFGFLITYHYLFPQLTMGLALIIFVLKVTKGRRPRRKTASRNGFGTGYRIHTIECFVAS